MSSSRGPGERLQAARIEIDLSVEDVASRMHLSNDIVEAIEENKFNDITAPIFVKGYLRAYARIVSLDEDEMIQQYAEFYSDEDPPISSTSNLTPEISTSDKRVKLITYLVILGLVVLLAIWWWNKYQTQTDLVSLDAQQSSQTQAVEIAEEPASAITIETQAPIETLAIKNEVQEPLPDTNEEPVDNNASIQVQPEPEPESEAMPALPEAESEAMPALPEAEPEPEPDKIATMDAGELPESINPEQPQQESEAEQSQESEAPAPVVLSDEITRMSPAGSDQLKIVVNADSWVEISDANGHRMLYTLIRANQKFNLTGEAPFTVFFGNGYGVEVTFNGEEVDLISRVRGDNTVKLKIGG